MSTHNSNKYLSRWMNVRISFSLKLSPLLASHIFHWWVLLMCCLPRWEHRGASSCLPAPLSLFTGSLPVTPHAMPSTSATGAGPCAGLSLQTDLELFFSGGQQYCQDLVWRDVLWALQEPDQRLNQTLAWHHFNYSVGQCRVVPASAAAHLAALKHCSSRKEF